MPQQNTRHYTPSLLPAPIEEQPIEQSHMPYSMHNHGHQERHIHTPMVQFSYPSMTLSSFVFSQYTIPCERHPERNEDSILVEGNTGLAAVFDGVGGSAAGQIASQMAVRATREIWHDTLAHHQRGRKRHTLLEHSGEELACSLLERLVQEADNRVRIDGAHKAGTDDLATTAALSIICREQQGYILYYAHVGDSRVYLQRTNEPLKRLTNDDGLLAKLVENQVVQEGDAYRIDQAMRASQLSDTEFSYFRLRGGITQALGGPVPPTIHIDKVAIQPGDRMLLCTDGIHDNLTDEEIEEILRSTFRTSTARVLVEHALYRSRADRSQTIRAKPDDMSAIVITCRF